MEAMYIDGEPLSNFGGRLVDWNYEKSLTNSILTGKDYALPSLLRSDVAQGTLTATIHVAGRNTADAHLRASQLVCRLNKTTDLQMPDGMIYRSALTKATQTDFTRWIVELSLEFTSVPHGPYVLIDPYVSGTPIYYDGTAPAGVKIEFDAPNDITDITIQVGSNEIQIINIPSGAHIVLDGINNKVTQNGVNKFNDTNLIDFPLIKPSDGPTVIQTSRTVSSLKIGYYPAYL